MLRVRKSLVHHDREERVQQRNLVYYVREGTPLNIQLVKFQHNKKKAGLVVDEYGDIKGLVTIEDILEEIVGDFITSMSPTLAEE